MKAAVGSVIGGAVLFVAVTCVAADDFLEKLKKAAEQMQQQLPSQQQKQPQPQAAPQSPTTETPPMPSGPVDFTGTSAYEGDSGTAEATAKIAKSVGKNDIIGIKLGMPAKEAAAVLQARGLQVKPETLKYSALPDPLTHGLYAVNQVVLRNSGLPPNAEKIYVTLTMPPNQQVVSKINRFLMFSKETVPTQQVLAADLVKKYGPVTYDAGPGALNPGGVRDMLWIEDPHGTRLKTISQQDLANCRTLETFSSGKDPFSSLPAGSDILPDMSTRRHLLEHGYTNPAIYTSGCGDYTIIHARLFYAYPLGISSPDVVGGLLVVMGNKPLDRSATDATHKYLIEAAKAREIKEKESAQKNRPAL